MGEWLRRGRAKSDGEAEMSVREKMDDRRLKSRPWVSSEGPAFIPCCEGYKGVSLMQGDRQESPIRSVRRGQHRLCLPDGWPTRGSKVRRSRRGGMHPSLAGGSGWAVTETEMHSRRTSWRRPLSPLLSLRQPEERDRGVSKRSGAPAASRGFRGTAGYRSSAAFPRRDADRRLRRGQPRWRMIAGLVDADRDRVGRQEVRPRRRFEGVSSLARSPRKHAAGSPGQDERRARGFD